MWIALLLLEGVCMLAVTQGASLAKLAQDSDNDDNIIHIPSSASSDLQANNEHLFNWLLAKAGSQLQQPSYPDNDMDKRKFSPWGGKRSDSEPPKRGFSPWGGKRSSDFEDNAITDEEALQLADEDKRAFNPWGGKRSEGFKRRFQPWGGKRAFSAWGGKRSFQPWGGKRAFQPWGGKRRLLDFSGPHTFDHLKRVFNPWGG